MVRTVIGASSVALGVLVAASLDGGGAFAETPGAGDVKLRKGGNVCYVSDVFQDAFRLDVRPHTAGAPLTTPEEEQRFGHPVQLAYSVQGKYIDVDGSVDTVHGTVVVALGVGATAGFDAISVRGDGQIFGEDFARPFQVECVTDEASPTPATWTCESRNEFDVYLGVDNLIAVDPLENELCSVFEADGAEAETPAEAGRPSRTGPAPQE